MALSSSPIAQIVGDARGRLLDEIVRSDRPRSVREWARRADVNHAHAGDLLAEFEQMGLIKSNRVGRTNVYQGVVENVLRKRLQGILETPNDMIKVAEQAAAGAPRDTTVILFGSVARRTQTLQSDVDVCIIAPTSIHIEDWVNRFTETLRTATGLPVNVLRYTSHEWDESLAAGETVATSIAVDGVHLTHTTP